MTTDLRVRIGCFAALFAGGMWLSKIAQPLYFDQSNALLAFGIGYAVMAVAGGLSFAWGALADRVGGLNAVRIGTLLYALGIAGRVFTDLLPVVIFSAVAGMGASLAMVGMRPWIRSHVHDDEIPRVVGVRNLGNQVGVFVGTLGAAAIFAVPAVHDGPRTGLLVAPVIVLLALACVMFGVRGKHEVRIRETSKAPPEERHGTKGLATRLMVIGVVSGFYVSLVTPYLPLVLTAGGTSQGQAAFTVSVMSLAQILTSWFIARQGTSRAPFKLFFLSELGTGAATLAAALLLGLGPVAVAVLLVLRAACVAVAVVSEETIQYAVIPAHAAGFIFGLSQTAFLVGDAVGGVAGATLWLGTGPTGLLVVAGLITVVNAFLLPTLLRTSMIPTPVR